jgi:DnaD/phage-associated family protein
MTEFITKMDFIPVSVNFIEKHMLNANGAYVKVYLYALNLAYKGISEDNSEIAKKLNLLESDVVNAFEYWSKEEIMTINNDCIYFNGQSNDRNDTIKKSPEAKMQKKVPQNVANIMSENKILADLCSLSQEILGKTLNNNDIETLYWFYDELGFSPEVIIMLLEYCVSKDKRNMKYIEKVAISWHENGIITMDAVDNYIRDEKEKNSYFYSLRKLFGITDRNLSKSEELYLKTWHDEYGMTDEMVALAYEYCILSTNKLSFPYINSIIKGWHEKGIKTIPDAEKDHEEFKMRNNNNNKFNERDLDVYNSDVDYDEIAKLAENNH